MSVPAHGGPDKEEEIPSSQPREMGQEEDQDLESSEGELEKENVGVTPKEFTVSTLQHRKKKTWRETWWQRWNWCHYLSCASKFPGKLAS